MKLPIDPRLPIQGSADYDKSLYQRLYALFRSFAQGVNDGIDGITANTAALVAHKTSADHDARYYTRAEIDALPRKPGEVIQQVMFSDAGATSPSEEFISKQNTSFTFTPKSTNSKIHIQYTFDGQVNAVSGVYTYGSYQVVQAAPTNINISQVFVLQAYNATNGTAGVEAPCALTCDEITNTSTDARVFALYGKVNGSAGTARNTAISIRAIVTEVAA